MNKYRAVRTHSELCGRTFASKGEAMRAEELTLLEKAGEITDLQFQVKYILNDKPRISITIDFVYCDDTGTVYEDHKGVLTRDFRSKMYWLRQKYGIDVILTGKPTRINPVGKVTKRRNRGLLELSPPDDGLCEKCHKPPDFRGLSRHHKKKRSQGGGEDKGNIIWLCGRCHSAEEGVKEL